MRYLGLLVPAKQTITNCKQHRNNLKSFSLDVDKTFELNTHTHTLDLLFTIIRAGEIGLFI